MHYFRSYFDLLSLTITGLSSHLSVSRPSTTFNLSGHITPAEIFSFVYVPFNVTPDVTSITVYQNYSLKGAGNALDLGIFDPRGIAPINGETGFSGSRGWSGGSKSNFTISSSGATPGYNAGPLLSGTWNVVLGPYATTRSGIDWTLDIVLDYAPNTTIWSPSYAPIYKDKLNQPTWLRGDFHMHSVYSDGRYLPSEQIANALARDLDFIFFSEHNTDSGNNDVGKSIPGDAGDLLIGRAIEVTTRHGHWQAIGLERTQQVEWRYTNASGDGGYANATTQVRNSGGLVSINHPFEECSRCDWTLDWEHHDAIEVWNGQWDGNDQQAVDKWQEELVRGKRVTAIGGSDAHSPPDINGLPTTVVRVEREKSQNAVVEGVRRGRTYLVEGPGMELDFWVEDKGGKWEMGDVVSQIALGLQSGKVVFIGRGFAGCKVCFVSERGYLRNESFASGQRIEMEIGGMSFVRAEVRNSTDIVLGLTNTIHLCN